MSERADQRTEQLYLVAPEALPDQGLLVTVTLPGIAGSVSQAALTEVQGFLDLLGRFYVALGGSGLRIEKLREARFDLPRLALASGPGDSIALDKFVEAFTRWVALERAG